jgi:hypothetical protein
MGSGRAPGPFSGLADPMEIEDGTLARMGSPRPGAVGLGAKGGSKEAGHSAPAPAAPPIDMGAQIVAWTRGRLDLHVPDGQCFALVDQALRAAGARSAGDYGPVTGDADYVWGSPTDPGDLQPGDVIQFRNYRCTRSRATEEFEGTVPAGEPETEERLHHTAIVQRVSDDGGVWVLEQNSPVGAPVREIKLYFASATLTSGRDITTIEVEAEQIWYYRPQPRLESQPPAA